MAANAQSRLHFTTDRDLLKLASWVPLFPAADRAVFYADDDGARLAAAFIVQNAAHTRLDELLRSTLMGRALWRSLTAAGHPWSNVEEVWWELSWRLARSARGIVHVFGPQRLVADRPLAEFRHRYSTGSYANTVFEKVELPDSKPIPTSPASSTTASHSSKLRRGVIRHARGAVLPRGQGKNSPRHDACERLAYRAARQTVRGHESWPSRRSARATRATHPACAAVWPTPAALASWPAAAATTRKW